ncbi:olfactory receptor 11A1-like [Hyla sarda]|uniref:olfactory receptor 11A1-like n=1 Tax=Hyla sarda TaxID=327740 RepID=UPI0024C25277|nr:olfactory receptor 11A1-like [Hyla sarda]
MSTGNQSSILFFQLLGFQNPDSLKIPLFCLFLAIYMFILSGNLLIMILVISSRRLQSPMYFFLSHLSLCDVFCTSNIIPNMLLIGILGVISVPVVNCFLQFYLFGCSTSTESFLLTVMSYDRYLAICDPLHYISIMDYRLRLLLAIGSWVLGFALTLIPGILVATLQYCGPNVIDHFFCDLAPFLKLSCSDVSVVQTEIIVFSLPIILLPFLVIIASYIKIFLSIMKISSKSGRKKAFSTCSSHLTVVCMYYGTLIIVYMVPATGDLSNIKKSLSLLYIVVTPLFNPVIYSLRNKELQTAMQKIIEHKKRV